MWDPRLDTMALARPVTAPFRHLRANAVRRPRAPLTTVALKPRTVARPKELTERAAVPTFYGVTVAPFATIKAMGWQSLVLGHYWSSRLPPLSSIVRAPDALLRRTQGATLTQKGAQLHPYLFVPRLPMHTRGLVTVLLNTSRVCL